MVTGAVLVELDDAKTEKPVWAGAYIMEGNTAQALMVMVDRVEKAVRTVLKKYPPKK